MTSLFRLVKVSRRIPSTSVSHSLSQSHDYWLKYLVSKINYSSYPLSLRLLHSGPTVKELTTYGEWKVSHSLNQSLTFVRLNPNAIWVGLQCLMTTVSNRRKRTTCTEHKLYDDVLLKLERRKSVFSGGDRGISITDRKEICSSDVSRGVHWGRPLLPSFNVPNLWVSILHLSTSIFPVG